MNNCGEDEKFGYIPPESSGSIPPGSQTAETQIPYNNSPSLQTGIASNQPGYTVKENRTATDSVPGQIDGSKIQTPLPLTQWDSLAQEKRAASHDEQKGSYDAAIGALDEQGYMAREYHDPAPHVQSNAEAVRYAAAAVHREVASDGVPIVNAIETQPTPVTQYQQPPQVDKKWMKPPYNQPYETPVSTYTMYTPGVYANNPYAHRRGSGAVPPPISGSHSGHSKSGTIARMICLILVCVLLSGLASYGVMEFRIVRGDFQTASQNQIQNQVVLGSSVTRSSQNEGISVATAPDTLQQDGMSPQDIYSMACSQVVGINTEIESTGGNLFSSMQESNTAVTGSGFIISSDGYILTNYHVVEDAYLRDLPLKVILHDETVYPAQVIGFEEANDVALIKIDATSLSAVTIADSEGIRVGQRIYAVGNPFGELLYTMTDGIVSALNRELTVDKKVISTFQLSAAVNSGNSGGPVYNTDGEVIGIVSAKIMSNYAEGIGFAIPINDAIAIAAELIEHGYLVGRALIGITVQTVSRGQAEYYGWGVEGAYVTSVSEDSAADKAGLLVADIITKLGEDNITSWESLNLAKRKYKAGDTTSVTVRRGGESGEDIELTITFDEDLSAGQPKAQG